MTDDPRIRAAAHALLKALREPWACDRETHSPRCDTTASLIERERADAGREALAKCKCGPAVPSQSVQKGKRQHSYERRPHSEQGPDGWSVWACLRCPVDSSKASNGGRWYRVDGGEWKQGFIGCERRARATETKGTP